MVVFFYILFQISYSIHTMHTHIIRLVHMIMSIRLRLFIVCSVIGCVSTNDNLQVIYEWKQIDFVYPSIDLRQTAIDNHEFIPENNLPLGIEIYGERLFVTVPRWKRGVAASLNYINMTDGRSPKLHPYPNWDAHRTTFDESPEIVSPFRVRADRCGRLWVMDTGMEDLLGDTKTHRPSRLLIYDLHNDALLRTYTIPEGQAKTGSFFANVAVEDHHCLDTFAYFGDLARPALLVYSWRSGTSWRIEHHYFHIDPLAGDFTVSGINFQWTDGLFGLALSSPDSDGFSTLYFHPMTGTHEFAVNTRYLRNETLAKDNFSKFRVLGGRGPKAQSGVSFLHENSSVLFYALVQLNAVACWRTTNPAYTMESQGRVYMSNITMVFPNDIKVDRNDNLWVLSNRLPTFMYEHLDPNDINFRILKASVSDAIENTACDSKYVLRSELKNRFGETLKSHSSALDCKLLLISFPLLFIYF